MYQAVIERLKKEKDMAKKNYYEGGFSEGKKFAESASYEELLYVAESSEGAIGVDSVFQDDLLGDYFRDLFTDSPVPDAHVGDFIAGWVDGVKDFWGDVKHQL